MRTLSVIVVYCTPFGGILEVEKLGVWGNPFSGGDGGGLSFYIGGGG